MAATTRTAPPSFADITGRLFALTAALVLCLACAAYGAAGADDEAAAPDDAAAATDDAAATEDSVPADDTGLAEEAPAVEEADMPADLPAEDPAADPTADPTADPSADPLADPASEDPTAETTEDPAPSRPVRERPVRRPSSYPEPSPYPLAWELKFTWEKPKRTVVELPGSGRPRAYWYLPYTVANDSGEEQLFIPRFELVTEDGKIHVSDRAIPKEVFDKIKKTEGNRLLEPPAKVVGPIRLGEDEARDSVAIWPEPNPEMGEFSIFISGLSGEFVEMADENGKLLNDEAGNPVILRKTLHLIYTLSGDELYAGIDPLMEGEIRLGRNARRWIMR